MKDLPVYLKSGRKPGNPDGDTPFLHIALEQKDGKADHLADHSGNGGAGNPHVKPKDQHRV